MFFTLLIVTFVVAALTSVIVARAFSPSLRRILDRLVSPEMSAAFHRYLLFAIGVVGVSGGVRLYDLQQYAIPRGEQPNAAPLVLNAERWTLEVYSTMIMTLQRIALLLFFFFVVALIAYAIVRVFELRDAKREMQDLRARRQDRDADEDRSSRGEKMREVQRQARREALRETTRTSVDGEPRLDALGVDRSRTEGGRGDAARPIGRDVVREMTPDDEARAAARKRRRELREERGPRADRPPREDRAPGSPREDRSPRQAAIPADGELDGEIGADEGDGAEGGPRRRRRRSGRDRKEGRPDRPTGERAAGDSPEGGADVPRPSEGPSSGGDSPYSPPSGSGLMPGGSAPTERPDRDES